MQAFKSTIEAKFKNSAISVIETKNILGAEVNEGISIPFIMTIDFITGKRLGISSLKSLLSEEITVTLKQLPSDMITQKSNQRSVHGIVTAYEEHGVYTKGIGESSKMFRYSLTVMPEIIKLADSRVHRSFTSSTVIDVIKSILADHSIDCNCDEEALWVEKPNYNTLVFTQSNQTDLEFLNTLCSDFGINYTTEYDSKKDKNIFVFSRGYVTGKDLASKTFSVTLTPPASFFDKHTLDDIVSSGGMLFGRQEDEKQENHTYSFSFLLNDTDSDKNRNKITQYCQKSKKAVLDNLAEKTVIKATDLNYAPGAILSVPDYDKDAKYTVLRSHIKIYSLGKDPANSEFSFLQTLVCVNKKNDDILGAVYQLSRVALDSRPSDIKLEKTDRQSQDSSESLGAILCIGTVCDESGSTIPTEKKEYLPAKGGDGSIPTKFYLKVGDSSKPIIVHYANSKSESCSYLSDFPRIGNKVIALKTGGNYIFYAYLPVNNSLDVVPSSVLNYQVKSKSMFESKMQTLNAVDQDINVKGFSVTKYDSLKDRIFSIILQGDCDTFIDTCVFKCNDLEIYNRYDTKKITLSDNSEETCKNSVKNLLSKLKTARTEYLQEKEISGSTKLQDKKKALTDIYTDLDTLSKSIIEDVVLEKNIKKHFSTQVSEVSSSGDINIGGKDVVITGDSITLKAKKIRIEADGKSGISLSADYALKLQANASSINMNPRKIQMGVRRCFIADLPYDTSLSLAQGINMSAVNVKINSLLSSSISDAFGASVKTSRGKAAVSGMDIAVKTIAKSDAVTNLRDLALECLEFLNFIQELLPNTHDNRNSDAEVGVTVTQTVVKAIFDINDKIDDIKGRLATDSETNPVVKAMDWAILGVEVVSMSYEIVESIVVVSLNNDPAENYKGRVGRCGYMSPQDWVKFSFFMLKTTFATIAAIAKTVTYYGTLGGQKGGLSITPSLATVEAPTVDFKATSVTKNGGPLLGQNLPAGQVPQAGANQGPVNNNVVQNQGGANNVAQNQGGGNNVAPNPAPAQQNQNANNP
ncbi:MAG: contractile injection system protein, VgrG/Pvc8 family [Succinivibrio sp.]